MIFEMLLSPQDSQVRIFPVIFVTLALFTSWGPAQEQSPKTSFFLPKNPVAAAYVLNRLSNKELIDAPRSEFVYTALLQRKGLDRRFRLEALEGLAKIRHTDALTELLRTLGELDQNGDDSEPVLRELGVLLLQNKTADLAAKRAALEKLASTSQLPLARQIDFAALMTADASPDRVWAEANSDSAKLADLLMSVPLLRDPPIRAALYPKVEPLLHTADSAPVRRAAITALATLPGHDPETFATLAGFVKSGTERSASVAALQRLPRKTWPKEQVESLAEGLVAYLQGVPVEQRTESAVITAFQFASDLTTLLPAEKAAPLSKTLRALGVSVFIIRTMPEQMLFDKSLIVVEPGKPVEIVLVNEDAMPHNMVIVMPGALEEIGQAAEKMVPDPDAQGRLYVPTSPQVLFATRMVEPAQEAKLAFTAPQAPGDYQYVCTFPGHWRRMVGTLAVTKDVEAYLATRAAAPQPTLTEWKIDDLAPELSKVAAGRNLASGKEFFSKLACAQCHKLGPEGNNYGPDLSDVFKRYQNDRAAILRQILEPSLIISNRYVNYEFELKNGESLLGMIVKEEGDALTIQTGPSDALIQALKKADVKERRAQSSSAMPLGLLYTLSKEQILDLLAYLESGGRIPAHEHSH